MDTHTRKARIILDTAKAEGRVTTEAERAEVEALLAKAEDERALRKALPQVSDDVEGSPLSLAFDRKSLETFRTQTASGIPSSVGAKAVQVEADFDVADGNALDFTQYPAIRSRVRVASLIPAQYSMGDGNGVTYFRPGTLATAGAAVAEGGNIPQSSPTYVAVTEPIRKMAHYAHVPGEAVQDQASFLSIVGGELLEGLIATENAQVLEGSGAGANLSGIFDTANRTGIQTRNQGADTVLNAVLKALDDVRSNGFVEPDAIVLRSSDWTTIRLLQDAMDRYVFAVESNGSPARGTVRTIDGVPVYLTEDGTASTVYVGAFKTAKLYVRALPKVESTISDGTDFLTDAVKLRVIERMALATPNEKAFCQVSLGV